MRLDLPKPIAVIAHDAGGANQIIALLQAYSDMVAIQAYMEGPASKLWQQAFPSHHLSPSLEIALKNAQSVLVGTGWASDLEYKAITKAKVLGLQTVAVLDHWVNYEQRFIRNGCVVKPDELWVVDKYALKLAIHCFPDIPVKQVPDCYLQRQVDSILPMSRAEQVLLYVLEPIRSQWGGEQAGEFQALDYMMENFSKMQLPKDVRILLRPHPSESSEKYLDWIGRHNSVALDNSVTLAEAISRAKWVAGCESYAMVVALASGRTVCCTLPPWAPECRLPHDQIICLING